MPDLALRFNRDVLIVDGAMGTMLLREGVPADECFEYLNILDPELIGSIHNRYRMAGAHCITTNTFGASRFKLASYGLADHIQEINHAGVLLARSSGAQHVLADVGPCGLIIEPLGPASFEEVYDQYYEQISLLAQADPDAILIETMNDIADARCAVLAAKAACDLPVIVSCTFSATGFMELSGTDPATAAIILESVGADVVGMNCGLDPKQILPFVEQIARATSLPLIVQPNAGIPVLDSRGSTRYPGTADEMAYYAERFRALGVQFIGSCCGSTPAFTGALYATVGDIDVVKRKKALCDGSGHKVTLASPFLHVSLGVGLPMRIIGERINPTGKPALAAQLESGVLSMVSTLAREQEAAGAHLIDVNVGVPTIDEAMILRKAVISLLGFCRAPLVLDTTNPVALEAALRVYPGRALINSVNGDPYSYKNVFPLARRYGAAVLVLSLDEQGIPSSVEGRISIINKVRDAAHSYGLKDSDLLFDLLTMTAATDQAAPEITTRGVRAVHACGLATVLGISNVSHGLPSRPMLNASFASLAIEAGLSAAIVNPNNELVTKALCSSAFLSDDTEFEQSLERWRHTLSSVLDESFGFKPSVPAGTNEPPSPPGTNVLRDSTGANEPPSPDAKPFSEIKDAVALLKQGILLGDVAATPRTVDEVIASGIAPSRIIDNILTPVLVELGEAFEQGRAFLPQLIIAANAMKAAVAQIKTYLPASGATGSAAARGTVVFCTVKGDIHSIGKDICIALLESQDIDVIDLGVDVATETIIDAAKTYGADVICLSALMTTSLSAMAETVFAIYDELDEFSSEKSEELPTRKAVFVGGAVVTRQWADTVKARYSPDAPSCVESILELLTGKG